MKAVRIRSFTHFSKYLLYSAYQFARASQEIERVLKPEGEAENRSFALGAVMSSVAFLETHINELFLLAGENTPFYKQLDSTARLSMKNIWVDVAQKFSVLSKYELALALNRCQPFDRGDIIYQDADALNPAAQ